MHTNTGHAIISGLFMVTVCWPFARPSSPAQAAERVFLKVYQPVMIGPELFVLPAPSPPTASKAKMDPASFTRFPPAYPEKSRRLGEEGRVEFRARCEARGVISDAIITKTGGSERLDRAVLAAARSSRWRCKPIAENGRPKTSWAEFAYRFNLIPPEKAPSPQRPPRP